MQDKIDNTVAVNLNNTLTREMFTVWVFWYSGIHRLQDRQLIYKHLRKILKPVHAMQSFYPQQRQMLQRGRLWHGTAGRRITGENSRERRKSSPPKELGVVISPFFPQLKVTLSRSQPDYSQPWESRKEACARPSFSCRVSHMHPALFLIKSKGPGWLAGFALSEHTWSYSSLEVCIAHAVWEGRHTLTWVFIFELHQNKHLHKWKVRRKCYKPLPAWEKRTVLHRCKVEWLMELCSLGFKVQVFKKTHKCISMHKAWMCRLTNTQGNCIFIQEVLL